MTEILYLAPEEIDEGERFRKFYELNSDFVENIKEHGVIQPIVITEDRRLLAGGRRLQAAEMAELESVPCVVRPTSGPLSELEIELFENVHRKDMLWHEEAALTLEIHRHLEKREKKWSQQKTAKALNKSQASISRELDVAEVVEKMPKLAEAPTMDKAVQTIKKMQEKALVGQMKKEHFERTEGENSEKFGAPDTATHPQEGGKNKKETRKEEQIQRALEQANQAYQVGDALDGMREFIRDNDTSKYVGLVEVDPPYGIDLQKAKRSQDKNHANLQHYNEVEQSDYPEFLETVAALTYESARDDAWLVFWYGHQWYYEVYQALTGAGWTVDTIPAVWIKQSGQTKQPEVNLARAYEPFLIGRKGSPVLRQRGRMNVFQYPAMPNSLKYHPTQRPLALMKDLLGTFAFPGDIVLSPFLGSGQTITAAYKEGLGCFGWDLSPQYKDPFLLNLKQQLQITEEIPTYEQAEREEQSKRPSQEEDDEPLEIESDEVDEELERLLSDG